MQFSVFHKPWVTTNTTFSMILQTQSLLLKERKHSCWGLGWYICCFVCWALFPKRGGKKKKKKEEMSLWKWLPGMHCTTQVNWDLHCEKVRAAPTPCQGHTMHGEQLASKATFVSANRQVGRLRQYPVVSCKSLGVAGGAGFQHLISLRRF